MDEREQRRRLEQLQGELPPRDKELVELTSKIDAARTAADVSERRHQAVLSALWAIRTDNARMDGGIHRPEALELDPGAPPSGKSRPRPGQPEDNPNQSLLALLEALEQISAWQHEELERLHAELSAEETRLIRTQEVLGNNWSLLLAEEQRQPALRVAYRSRDR